MTKDTTRKTKQKKAFVKRDAARSPQTLDIHVGKRIRMRRSLMGISQEELAESVGITFQQIQKYERGVNRVSASRLFHIGKTLDVPISYFYAEFSGPRESAPATGLSDNKQDGFAHETDELLYNKESAELLRAYYSIQDDARRKELLKIIRSMVDNMRQPS